MTNEQARIRLAEAMGWETDGNGNWRTAPYDPQISSSGWISQEYLPDPFTDANDCEALILWLDSQGISVELEILDGEWAIALWDMHRQTPQQIATYEGTDWKAGVTRAALEVLNPLAADAAG